MIRRTGIVPKEKPSERLHASLILDWKTVTETGIEYDI
jgi:hypothetical protein